MKLPAPLRALLGLTALSPLAIAACAAPTGDGGVSGHSALSADDDGGGVASDEDLQYFEDHGFGGIRNSATCVSRTDGGADIAGDTLPVGGGRWLECTTASKVSVSTMEVLSSANVPWCVLGAVASSEGAGDPRLVVTITSAPADGPWTLKATHDGDAIDITPIAGPFGSTMWPVWVNATYTTTDMREAGDAASCDAVFAGE